MRATLTSKGQITLPIEIRRKLGLETGDVLEFDTSVPYILARKPFDRARMKRAVGRGRTKKPSRTSAQWMEELRGSADAA